MTLNIPTPASFRLAPTVYSHGWSALPPFRVIREPFALERILNLASGDPVVVTITQNSKMEIQLRTDGVSTLTAGDRSLLERQVLTMLRLHENLEPFYREARRNPRFRWIPKLGAGRMLSCPTVFEDIVKMICTTNCSWALTEAMVGNLCRKLGSKVGEDAWTFPTPDALGASTEKFLRKEIRAGYRSPYLVEFARRITAGEINPEGWRHSSIQTDDLFRELRSIKGVGPYAAGNILKLLGRYDHLGIDSWCIKRYAELYRKGRKVSNRTIEKHYHAYGSWRGLFFWLDMTEQWYREKFPF